MSEYHIVRGSEIRWRLTFFDEFKNPTSPPNVTLHVAYKNNKLPKVDLVTMQGDIDGKFTASWDSSVADAGMIHWHVRATGGSPHAIDGKFFLLANPANPGPT